MCFIFLGGFCGGCQSDFMEWSKGIFSKMQSVAVGGVGCFCSKKHWNSTTLIIKMDGNGTYGGMNFVVTG